MASQDAKTASLSGRGFISRWMAIPLARRVSQRFTIWRRLCLPSSWRCPCKRSGTWDASGCFLGSLPFEKIPLLLTFDWFLDRCRTTINVLGDVNVSCILDGRTPPTEVKA